MLQIRLSTDPNLSANSEKTWTLQKSMSKADKTERAEWKHSNFSWTHKTVAPTTQSQTKTTTTTTTTIITITTTKTTTKSIKPVI